MPTCVLSISLKRFDCVNLNVVIRKLIDLGVRRSIIPVICSFLAERTQNTKLNGHLSSSQGISCGVPQGTKLGPILFLVLINDASAGCCRRWKYVDDLTLGEVVQLHLVSNPFKARREDLVYKFGVKLLHSARFRDFLPPYRESISRRQFRSSTLSGLLMPKCQTDRHKMSTIPYIIRSLP